MQVFTQTLTFDGLGSKTISDLASNNFKCSRLLVEQVQANTHISYCGDSSFAQGTSIVTHLIKQLAIPDTNKLVPLDQFLVTDQKGANAVDTTQYSFDGTSGEKLNVTIWVF